MTGHQCKSPTHNCVRQTAGNTQAASGRRATAARSWFICRSPYWRRRRPVRGVRGCRISSALRQVHWSGWHEPAMFEPTNYAVGPSAASRRSSALSPAAGPAKFSPETNARASAGQPPRIERTRRNFPEIKRGPFRPPPLPFRLQCTWPAPNSASHVSPTCICATGAIFRWFPCLR